VLSPRCLDLIEGDASTWEGKPLAELANMGELRAFEHNGFWQPMDTLRENCSKPLDLGQAPWKIW
jgi:glucose-1-phosphate cytidylyltransferase